MRILVHIALEFPFFILLHKKKKKKEEREVVCRCLIGSFSAGVVRGSEVSQRHLKVAPAGSEVSRATLQGRSRFRRRIKKNRLRARSRSEAERSLQLGATLWERHLGVARVFDETELKN